MILTIIDIIIIIVRTRFGKASPERGQTSAQEAQNKELVEKWVETLGFS